MLKVSYANCPSLSLVISVQFALEMCVAAKNHQKIQKNLYLDVQGHCFRCQSKVKSQCRLLISD